MRFSLRLSVMLVVAAINVVAFGVGLAWLTDSFAASARAQDSEYAATLAQVVQNELDPEGNIDAPDILGSSLWDTFRDAIVVRLPRGVFLNPVGSAHRPADFDQVGVLNDIQVAVRTDAPIFTDRGIAMPILDASGNVWGGCWFEYTRTSSAAVLLRQLMPWFLVSTLLLTLGTFSAMRRLVLDPVAELAKGVERIEQGDLGVRLAVPRRRNDEVAALMQGFNEMASQVQGFGETLQREVEVATEKAKSAEAAAMTQRRLAATGELAAGLAHEINNPLGGMLNALEVLQRGDLPDEKREQYFELLKGGLERIHGTVGRVLRLAPREATTTEVRLADPLGDALGLVRHRADKLGVKILYSSGGRSIDATEPEAGDFFSHLPPVLGESNELGQAFLNLLVNALDSLEEKLAGDRHLEIALEQEGAELHLAFEDDGPGMDKEILDRAPNLFFTTKDAGRGTGLGLAIVHNVVASHGGRIFLSSEAGRGFRVDIYLPVSQEGLR